MSTFCQRFVQEREGEKGRERHAGAFFFFFSRGGCGKVATNIETAF